MGLVDDSDLQVGRWITRLAVMVAAHQHAVHTGMPGAPLPRGVQHAGLLGGGGMQEVTEENDACSAMAIDQRAEPVEIVLRRAAGSLATRARRGWTARATWQLGARASPTSPQAVPPLDSSSAAWPRARAAPPI